MRRIQIISKTQKLKIMPDDLPPHTKVVLQKMYKDMFQIASWSSWEFIKYIITETKLMNNDVMMELLPYLLGEKE